MNLSKIKAETVIDTPKEELNPKFYDGMKLKRRIRKVMLELFNHLIEEFPLKKVQQFILEKNLVGSLTSFQWSNDSDVDLHIVIDDENAANEYNTNSLEILETLRTISKQLNGKFYLLGHKVEFYVQSQNEPFYSDGVYDIEYDVWSKIPDIKQFDKDKVKEAKKIAKQYKFYILSHIKKIDKKYKNSSENKILLKSLKNDLLFLTDEMKKLSNDRNEAIRHKGNDSIINMKFKFLQRMGVLKKIKETRENLKSIFFEPT